MGDGIRIRRINELLRVELARLIQSEVKDPRTRGVTVTGVEATPDLAHATVFVRHLSGEAGLEQALEGLHSAASYMRRQLGRELRLRRIPALEFRADHTLENARRIEELLGEARRPSTPSGPRGGSPPA